MTRALLARAAVLLSRAPDLHVLSYASGAGTSSPEDAAQMLRIIRGSHELAELIAQDLKAAVEARKTAGKPHKKGEA